MVLNRFRVELHETCIRHAGREEYPDGAEGRETIPPMIAEAAVQDGATNIDKAYRLYEASGAYRYEGLRFIGFPRPFTGKDANRRPQVKTQKIGEGLHAMWIPATLLKAIPAPMANEAVVAVQLPTAA